MQSSRLQRKPGPPPRALPAPHAIASSASVSQSVSQVGKRRCSQRRPAETFFVVPADEDGRRWFRLRSVIRQSSACEKRAIAGTVRVSAWSQDLPRIFGEELLGKSKNRGGKQNFAFSPTVLPAREETSPPLAQSCFVSRAPSGIAVWMSWSPSSCPAPPPNARNFYNVNETMTYIKSSASSRGLVPLLGKAEMRSKIVNKKEARIRQKEAKQEELLEVFHHFIDRSSSSEAGMGSSQ
ncbi:uncharacterized protein LOC100305942 [Anopheles sinensis]|uniref:Uncharacterized protein LOC100305942 n=1 Tax=Anopheles sinensis TaxID=74873 RepID=A0A084W4C2_ANOSI|nr:uncharacterized protein LOC100305942 [Anopheles sinensis]